MPVWCMYLLKKKSFPSICFVNVDFLNDLLYLDVFSILNVKVFNLI